MDTFSEADRAYGIGVGDEVVPESGDDVPTVVEHGVGQVVGAEDVPDILDRVQLRSLGRQKDRADVAHQFEFWCRKLALQLCFDVRGVGCCLMYSFEA